MAIGLDPHGRKVWRLGGASGYLWERPGTSILVLTWAEHGKRGNDLLLRVRRVAAQWAGVLIDVTRRGCGGDRAGGYWGDTAAEVRLLRKALMGGDVASLAAEMTPYVSAAVGAYGGAVLAKLRDEAADATVGLGRRLLQRIFGTRGDGEPLPGPLADLAADPGDGDALAAVRLVVGKALAADPVLAGRWARCWPPRRA